MHQGDQSVPAQASAIPTSSSSESSLGLIMSLHEASLLDRPKSLDDLPMLVVEYIITHFSYYEVLQFRFISRYWNEIVKGYLGKADRTFLANLQNYNVQWVAVKEQIEDFTQSFENVASSSKKHLKNRCVPKMSPRYHHSACYVGESMFVFGGCISSSTAYNDLWRFDVSNKMWHRVIAAGNLPLPRLFCSFTYYQTQCEHSGESKQYIVLFGGFLFDEKLDVKERLLSTIHFFDIDQNRWTLIPVSGEIQLKSGNHSAVIIGDELIVFNGLRMVGQQEIESKEVYVFDLKRHFWSLQKTSITSYCPFIRTTMESYRNQSCIRRKMVQTPFALDKHNILYICGCNTNVLFIAAFLLKRTYCGNNSCHLCHGKCPEQLQDQKDSCVWEWVQVDISKIGLDFEFTYGGEFCKIGNLLAYLTVKNITIPRKNKPTASISQLRAQLPREHIPYANKRLLRERRIETLDFYQKHIEMQNQLRLNGSSPLPEPVVHKSTLQLRLLDASRVISENRIYKLQHVHEMDYTVSPEAISCYSLVASPQSLILFGGFVIDDKKEVEIVSNKLFMIVSKPAIKLH